MTETKFPIIGFTNDYQYGIEVFDGFKSHIEPIDESICDIHLGFNLLPMFNDPIKYVFAAHDPQMVRDFYETVKLRCKNSLFISMQGFHPEYFSDGSLDTYIEDFNAWTTDYTRSIDFELYLVCPKDHKQSFYWQLCNNNKDNYRYKIIYF